MLLISHLLLYFHLNRFLKARLKGVDLKIEFQLLKTEFQLLFYERSLNNIQVSCCCYCHKPPGLKQLKFIFLKFWMPKVWNQFHWAKIKMLSRVTPSWASRGKSVSLPSSSSHGSLYPLACGHSSIFKTHYSYVSFTPTSWFTSPAFLISCLSKDSCHNI